jgi:succinoglycan biosynthesis transport protein ExoP
MEEDFSESQEGGKSFSEYFSALHRRKWQILAVAMALAPIALVIALVLPPVYRSTARILVQEQEVPPDLVRSTITSFADERIQVISNQVMTRAQLLALVDKFDLYPKLRKRLTEDEIIERMHRDIKLTTVNADISDRSSGRRVNATIAFTISYDAPQPERAQEVVNELVSLYMSENVKVRQQSVAETTAFLTQEAERLGKQIQDMESKLADFKRRNVGRMPDSSTVNIQLADRTESELQRVERDIGMLQDRKASLEAQLVLVRHTTPPAINAAQDRNLTPEERLRALQAQYANISAVYGADHPDVRRIQREMAALRAATGASGAGDTAEQRKRLEADLAALKERYGDDHPDVQRLRRAIAALGAPDAKATTVPGAGDKRPAVDPMQRSDNPAYVLLSTQLESTQRELAHLSAAREDLRAKQRTYDARLLQIPEVEREYSELTRDYANAQKRYSEIKTKQMQAEGAVELEKELKAERFSLGEPANLPQKPFSPNRPVLALGGVVASLGSGLVLALVREAFDPSIKGPMELSRIAPVPILAAIPYIETRGERAGKRRRALVLMGLASLLAVTFVLVVHLFVKPLPEMFDSVLRKIPTL